MDSLEVFLIIIVCIIFGAISSKIVKDRGYGISTAVMYFFIGFCLPLIGLLLAISKKDLNKPENSSRYSNATDELKKIKNLYDAGVLTESEYRQKRDELVKKI